MWGLGPGGQLVEQNSEYPGDRLRGDGHGSGQLENRGDRCAVGGVLDRVLDHGAAHVDADVVAVQGGPPFGGRAGAVTVC